MNEFTATEVSFNNGYQTGVEALVSAIKTSKYCHSASEEWPMLITLNSIQLDEIAQDVISHKRGL